MFRPAPIKFLNKHRGQRGFTLIEVAVILMIIAIITAFLVPQVLAWMRLYRLGVGSRNVATALQRARFLATSNNTRAAMAVKAAQVVRIQQYDQLASADVKIMAVIEMP